MSIYWVKDTVNADNVGTVDTFADPYGIQIAFDTAVAGDEIRIVTGANNYNSASTSWNNRDDASKTINIDTNSGTTTSYIKVLGYTDETTEGEVTLDFDSASVVGGDGFTQTTVVRYLFKNIHITDCDVDGFGLTITNYLFSCRATSCGGVGINGLGQSGYAVNCQGSNNATGITGLVRSAYCEMTGNSGTGISTMGDDNVAVSCLYDDNTGDGALCDDFNTFVHCTFEDNDDGIGIDSDNTDNLFLNCAFTNNTNYGIANAAGYFSLINCGSFGNGTAFLQGTAAINISPQTTDPQYTDAGARDYSIGTNWRAQGEGGFVSGDLTGYVDIGAVQRQEPGGSILGGGNLAGGFA